METEARYRSDHLNDKQLRVRQAAENRFYAFVRLVAPWLELGHIHEDVCDWLQHNLESGNTHQLALLPRGHLKSTLIYLWACWRIVKNPAVTIIYASASHKLAELQTSAMQHVLEGPEVSLYWPELVNRDKGKREVWRQHAFAVDHPYRAEKGVRDYTMQAMGIGHGVTGAHADILMLDDIVAPEAEQYSPWTQDGRKKLETWYSFMTSVLNPGGEVNAIGTRYHARDLYSSLLEAYVPEFDGLGNELERTPLYCVMIQTVETNGTFLWPRKKGKDGKFYGFDQDVLAQIRAGYIDKSKFYSQYYQDPVDPESQSFSKDFQYYDPEKLVFREGKYYLKQDNGGLLPLNVYAAVDIASSVNKESDFTAIVILGVDPENRRYVLAIDRFKTDRASIIIDHLFNAFDKWRWKRLRVEVVGSQKFVYTELRDQMKYRSIFFNLDEYRPRPSMGSKRERIVTILEPLYANKRIYHHRGGNCEILEEELVMDHAPHDDIADALAMVNEIAQRPIPAHKSEYTEEDGIIFHPRFGGVSHT